jgi:hypothetical protein
VEPLASPAFRELAATALVAQLQLRQCVMPETENHWRGLKTFQSNTIQNSQAYVIDKMV